MSGPKDFSTPPRYSISVFNGMLNEVFKLQSQLKSMYQEINDLKLKDNVYNININFNEECKRISNLYSSSMQTLLFDYKGTFGQSVYNELNRKIELKITDIKKVISECEIIKLEYDSLMKDYEIYKSYVTFYDNSIDSLTKIKYNIIDYLNANFSEKTDLIEESTKDILAIEFEVSKIYFRKGFSNDFESAKSLIINHLINQEKIINSKRISIGKKVIESTGNSQKKIIPLENQKTDKKEIVNKIETIINNCDDVNVRIAYDRSLDQLKSSKHIIDNYYFIELYNSIYESEKKRKLNKCINQILYDLSKKTFHGLVQIDLENLINYCVSIKDKYSISETDIEIIRQRADALIKLNNHIIEEEEIKSKEHFFLKSQLILCLENKGYEVMDDLQVVDFEKEDDILLKVNGQDNYLNLIFKADGSIRYVFQIPENKYDLSTDQQNIKLYEMESTCSDFKNILSDLKKMGLNLTLNSEMPVNSSTIVTITKKNRAKIKSKKPQAQSQNSVRKKYLI